jgi:hypothetical protein
MNDLLTELRERYCEIVEIFDQYHFKFPLELTQPPFQVIDGKPYTGDGQLFEPPSSPHRQDGSARFETEVEILKAAGISAEMVSGLTGIDVETVSRIYSKELGYQQIFGPPGVPHADSLKYHALGYFASTIAKTLCATLNYCDYEIVRAVTTIEKTFSPKLLPTLTGISRETLDMFKNEPSSLQASDKYLLTFKVMEITKMIDRVRVLSGNNIM